MADKFFLYPFAFAGTRTAIPDDTQPSGVVSYEDGYGPDYALDQFSDPDAKNIERGKWNQLLYDITNVIRSLQTVTYPAFITSADNGGTPFSYGVGALCRFDPGSGMKNYRSKVSSNTTDPSNTTNWEEIGIFATNAIALTGTSTTAYMTPANTKFVIDALTTTIASTYAPLESPAFTGNPTVPNQSPLTNNTRAANTAYVDAAVAAIPTGSFLPLAGGNMTGALNEAKGAAIASASSTNIGAMTGNYGHITGTTTIVDFGTAPQAGVQRILEFDGILTLTNGANLVCLGNANIITAAGDRAVFVADTTTKWVMTGYARAGTGSLAALLAGTGPNNIVQLNGSSQLPALDGSLLTNLNASSIVSLGTITTTSGTSQSLNSLNLTAYKSVKLVWRNVGSNSTTTMSIGGNVATPTTGAANQGICGFSEIDLASGIGATYSASTTVGGSGVASCVAFASGLSNASTSITVTSSGTYDSGQIDVYGLK